MILQCKQRLINRYGVDNVFKLQSTKNKIKKTNKDRYGEQHATKSQYVKNKIKKNNLQKYGCEHIFQNNQIKQKINKTLIDNYGGRGKGSKIIGQKIKKTFLTKYGVETPQQNYLIKCKTQKTFIQKYGGVLCGSKELNQKIKKTNLIKYGVQFPQSTIQVKQKMANTNILRYGVRVPVQNDNIKQKIRLTTISNYGAIGFASEELRKKIKKSYAIQKQYKLKDGRIINYQSNLQKKFIIFCQKKNILIYDGDIIEYTFKEKVHKYFIDFRVVLNQINFLVQIKGMHPYYRESINGGSMLAKYNGVLQYLKDKDNYQYTFIVGENFNELYR